DLLVAAGATDSAAEELELTINGAEPRDELLLEPVEDEVEEAEPTFVGDFVLNGEVVAEEAQLNTPLAAELGLSVEPLSTLVRQLSATLTDAAVPPAELEEIEQEAAVAPVARADEHEGLEDHVRMYLREIGMVPLL